MSEARGGVDEEFVIKECKVVAVQDEEVMEICYTKLCLWLTIMYHTTYTFAKCYHVTCSCLNEKEREEERRGEERTGPFLKSQIGSLRARALEK